MDKTLSSCLILIFVDDGKLLSSRVLRGLSVQLIFAYLCMSAESKTPGVSILPWDYSAAAGEQSGEFS